MPLNDSLFLTGNAYGVDIKILVDTEATLSVLHPDKYYTIPKKRRPRPQPYKLKLRMGDGALGSTLGCSVIPLVFNGQLLPQKMVIADIDVSGVLGYDFLYENAVSINVRDGSLALHGSKVQCFGFDFCFTALRHILVHFGRGQLVNLATLFLGKPPRQFTST